MTADGDPRRFALGVGLDDIDLRARRVNTHPEAGHLPIPEYGVLALPPRADRQYAWRWFGVAVSPLPGLIGFPLDGDACAIYRKHTVSR